MDKDLEVSEKQLWTQYLISERSIGLARGLTASIIEATWCFQIATGQFLASTIHAVRCQRAETFKTESREWPLTFEVRKSRSTQ